ncbi:MAG: Plug domain-containing protein [Gammaproteobacteria bacterium]
MSFISPSASLSGCKILYLACLLVPFASHAEHAVLPDVTVEGSQQTQPISLPSIQQARDRLNLAPGGVDVIDAEQYKQGRSSTLRDVLGWSPGVFVQPRFGSEESRLSIRGSGLQRTFHLRGIKLLQDGVPLSLADGGGDFQAIEPLALQSVPR